jgi:hypothetical protein
MLAIGGSGISREDHHLISFTRQVAALSAMERGWEGPPYDTFQLAELLGIDVVARHDLDDARLVSAGGQPRIEFNPRRRRARVRFSVAHEIGHSLFDDYAQRARYRDESQHRSDDWQLEILCNVAAAEFLMPAGALPIREAGDLSLAHLLDQRARFEVSSEALLRRVVKPTDRPACVFAAARLGGSDGFRIDYLVGSRVWRPRVKPGQLVGPESVLTHCTAVGFADHATECWDSEEMMVQAVGVPPYPGDALPRLVGLLEPAVDEGKRDSGLRYVRGDATQPRGDGPVIIAHIVNDRARRWGRTGVRSRPSPALPGHWRPIRRVGLSRTSSPGDSPRYGGGPRKMDREHGRTGRLWRGDATAAALGGASSVPGVRRSYGVRVSRERSHAIDRHRAGRNSLAGRPGSGAR